MINVGMFNTFLTCHWFADEAKEIWTDENTLQGWLDIESALAKAQAEIGMIPQEAAEMIAAKADASIFDFDEIKDGIKETMHPLVPFLRQYERLCGSDAGAYIHWGATTQNIIDGGAVLQLRKSHALLLKYLDELLVNLASLASRTSSTVQAGRTHGQQALPITFGMKVAAWHEEVSSHKKRLNQTADDALEICMGGAAGTFASMAGNGQQVQDKMAEMLSLKAPTMPVRTMCDNLSAYLAMKGLMAATFEKIAREMIFLQRTEINEASEGFHYGKIGSSTMPQKRNPQLAMNIAGISQMLRSRMDIAAMSMVRSNEGDAVQENIMDMLVPEMSIFAISLAKGTSQLIEGCQVNEENMLVNLQKTKGLILSESVMLELAKHVGRPKAHHIIYNATLKVTSEGISFTDAVINELQEQDLSLTAGLNFESLLDPNNYLGEIRECISRQIIK
ncbi:adenylosuccinate lyase family protein [Vibrio crassostreae]|uniref:class-II fumarase/aspartase family protein n=1 Tax=Vibrio crassostreae TaxID=246167 RepID=UPI00200A5F72|nr:adenylosuccinate lyase family protein [Vibrio crassostreae]UPR28347.1 adenylosuccinate lyase family protein [Vibrio crassostreae]